MESAVAGADGNSSKVWSALLVGALCACSADAGTPSGRESGSRAAGSGAIGAGVATSSDGPTPCSDPNCMPDESSGVCVFVMLGCGAATPGATYYALARITKGLTASLCESDFSPIFDRLSAAVSASAPLPCNYQIPPPPAGETLDPTKVNVGWKAPNASDQQLFRKASDQAACASELGWYYDDDKQPKQLRKLQHTITRGK